MNPSWKPSKLLVVLLGILVISSGMLMYAKYQEAQAETQFKNLLKQGIHVQMHDSASSTPSAASTTSVSAISTTAHSQQMHFEVVTTQAAQEQGLGGRASIPDNYAMLFVFPKDDTYGFWMKDMLVPIDMIWVSDSGTIVKIDASVQPDTYPNVFYPPVPVRYVLETKAGFAAEKNWHIGTHVALPLPY